MSRETGRLTILHVSDVHVTRSGRLYGSVDGAARLCAAADWVRQTGVTPEAVVVTGDLVERGNGDAYAIVQDALDELERAAGVPVLTVLGNHDDPEAARMLRGHGSGHARVVLVDDLRFLLLDSSRGDLGEEQIAWVRRALREPHGSGTVVALHHPPVASPMPTLARAGLRDADALLDALDGSDVRAVLAGHFHHPMSATLRGIPVSVGPSLAYHQVMDAGPDRVSGHDSAMFSLVHLLAGGVAATSVSLRSPDPLFTSQIA
ncbi:3',5'-cyclic adenosine monophosphate phosphodiesterase CpdA [Microbacterium faecale]|uniref:3',5'-cyclic adenosine monophosphate phosphodiesterase CpdA n=1 Tax=Microbacterium faecale TaxID=1804630 RepID=A0A917DCQ6_9MICO|nr:metallophosphoesterase [Microbacterium faecale]GGD27159.1 3',5'-cyclic adenosine monophosphate phosphodiesterase CpdA [Microbacterium faecale]